MELWNIGLNARSLTGAFPKLCQEYPRRAGPADVQQLPTPPVAVTFSRVSRVKSGGSDEGVKLEMQTVCHPQQRVAGRGSIRPRPDLQTARGRSSPPLSPAGAVSAVSAGERGGDERKLGDP
ncbi:hypothetical protein AAFF_G00094970 [Aldrovandia affinis]|uniref:Uncharacterized protein n=1 Tax=Aldrovandia affinis TaxID=143900 RepID=A0AAD7WC81_9TELE|nr:hypothetical protein AAFF_G00094970 [Aldrovandia affinis]